MELNTVNFLHFNLLKQELMNYEQFRNSLNPELRAYIIGPEKFDYYPSNDLFDANYFYETLLKFIPRLELAYYDGHRLTISFDEYYDKKIWYPDLPSSNNMNWLNSLLFPYLPNIRALSLEYQKHQNAFINYRLIHHSKSGFLSDLTETFFNSLKNPFKSINNELKKKNNNPYEELSSNNDQSRANLEFALFELGLRLEKIMAIHFENSTQLELDENKKKFEHNNKWYIKLKNKF